MANKVLSGYYPSLGADPELFLISTTNKNKGKVIESNKIIPKDGLRTNPYSDWDYSKCTVDGVQVELNPIASTCREGAGNRYITMFQRLVNYCKEHKTTLSTNSIVHFTKEDLDKLSDESKRFGCEPSNNYYTHDKSKITVNPNVYQYRSAGGHIHIGNINWLKTRTKSGRVSLKNYKSLVNLLDIVLGNTCVMIDRDDNQKERRKVYGRAGEYRLPIHGLEYRTLSNFWINNYQLMSMVYGFTRLAVCIMYSTLNEEKRYKFSSFRTIFKKVSKDNIQTAINDNDFDLAKKNWDSIKDTLVSMIPATNGGLSFYPINSKYLKTFEHFISKGLDYWFKDDCITHWTKSLKSVYDCGWEKFLTKVVDFDMRNNGNMIWSMNMSGIYVRRKDNVRKKE